MTAGVFPGLRPPAARRPEPVRDRVMAGGAARLDPVVEMAHDLRSPLASILLMTEALGSGEAGPVTERQRRQLGLIYSATLTLCTMADDVVELTRDGTSLVGAPGVVSVPEVVRGVRDVVRPMAEAKGLALIVNCAAVGERRGHEQALGRVLLNLATNALKATDHGFVKIGARAPADVPDRIEFSVTDSGPGLAPEEARALLHAGDDGRPAGAGLGLALCRRLVDAMGSELQCESRPGAGTRFSFALRLSPVATAA